MFNLISNPDKSDEIDPDLMLTTPMSNYYSISQINNSIARAGPKAMSMFHCNIRSLQKNLALLEDFLYSLDKRPEILAITETRLNANSICNVDLLNYELYHTDSPTSAGGAAIYITKTLKSIPRPDIKFNMQLVESCWVEINPCNGKSPILIGSIYRHPGANMEEFAKQLDDLIKKVQNRYQLYILGDMNIDFLKYNSHALTEEYLDMLHSNNISPIITKPTRITNYTATLIDHIYTNNTNQIISGIATIDISDHLPTFCIVDIPVQKQKCKRYYRDYSQFDSELYLQDIKAIDWSTIHIESNDLNGIATKTIRTLQLIVNKHAPRKQISKTKQKQFSKPWITNGILKSIKNKQSMYRTHFLSNNPAKTAEYKKYANKLNHLKAVSKKVYYCKQFNLHRSNLKATWKLIGTLIKRKTKGQTSPSRITINDKTFTNKLDIAEQFNKYFISVGPSLASTIDHYDEEPTKYINKSPVSSFIMSPVEAPQVCRLFQNLNENKTSLDIPNKLIKIASEPLSLPFTYIYNQSIANGIVPDVFKISRVTPIYKSGEVTDTGNYRPIATLSSFSKVLERLIYNQLYQFLEKNDIIYKYQFGFRKGYSTEQAILEITDNLNSAIDNKQITCGLFLDFSKAFDTVNHDILLSKLYTYGIRGTPFKWFKSYLSNRTQFVKIDEIESSMATITCGVPQGSNPWAIVILALY